MYVASTQVPAHALRLPASRFFKAGPPPNGDVLQYEQPFRSERPFPAPVSTSSSYPANAALSCRGLQWDALPW
ncbi:MAG: hypothetical protein EAS52_18885 [Parapedobacter sp.]|nr:MAG: hypothetical protein EAS52_18885 [Parapedobacter sp.]